MKRFLVFIFILVIFFSSSKFASAKHRGKVLGTSTTAAEVSFPPVTAGTGFFLPDSPFYFLDKAFQQVKLATTFSPEAKAKLRAKIAGERLAELRVMFAKNNDSGINEAISGLVGEIKETARNVSDARSRGKEVSRLAKEINDIVKNQKEILQDIDEQTQGELKFKIKAAKSAVTEAKVEVEDSLSEVELENEIEDALEDEIEDELDKTTESAEKIDKAIFELNKQAEEAAKKALKNREEALKKAIREKNELLKKEKEGLLKSEKIKQEFLLKQQKLAGEQAIEAAKRAREAAKKALEMQKKANEIKNTVSGSNPITTTTSNTSNSGSSASGSSVSSNSGSSGNSGSGSLNSDLENEFKEIEDSLRFED